jgi:hypothetical protein
MNTGKGERNGFPSDSTMGHQLKKVCIYMIFNMTERFGVDVIYDNVASRIGKYLGYTMTHSSSAKNRSL